MIEAELNQLFKPDYIFINIKPVQATKKEALKSVSKLCAKKCGFNADILLKELLAREVAGSTDIGEGIAIPHAKISDLNTPIIAIARFDGKINWNFNDELIEVAIVLIIPKENNENIHINVLSAFARKLIHKEFTTALKNIKTANELYQFIIQELSII